MDPEEDDTMIGPIDGSGGVWMGETVNESH